MKSNVYSIYDKKAKCYGMPFLAHNHAVAARMVQASMDEVSLLAKYPHDYCLECVGSFSDEDGSLIPLSKKEIVSEVSNLSPLPFDDGVGLNENGLAEDN